MNIIIGDKKTFDDWRLKLLAMSISMPEVKLNQVDIPGADGLLDLTQALGPVRYANRQLELSFDVNAEPDRWHSLTSRIANYLHGQNLKVTLESDPEYYYMGRLALNSEKSDYRTNHITITGDMDPYKYEQLSTTDDWLWDPFDLEDGIIRDYKDMAVDGSLRVTVLGSRKDTIPTIIADQDMTVEWDGVRYPLKAGANKVYAISVTEGENILAFYGHGTVSIDYRGGIL